MDAPDKPPAALTGFLVLDKPIGLSSMEAVTAVRTRAGGRRKVRVGHAGTLDPLASGVLVLAFGAATRHLDRVMHASKTYRVVIDLSGTTAGGDLEHEPMPVTVDQPPDEPAVRAVLEQFAGVIDQRPPAYSAVMVAGARAYELARAGRPPQLQHRRVEVHELQLLRYDWPTLELRIVCGKGFYVRSLAVDLGAALGTGGHVVSLRRTAVGPFTETLAVPLDRVPDTVTDDQLIRMDSVLAMLESTAGGASGSV
jgi:tRNA pseudouridine55 synthase